MQKYGLDQDEKGVIIISIKDKSPASHADLHEGDVIKKINNRDIGTVSEYSEATKGAKSGQSLLLYVKRQGNLFYVGVKIK